MGKYRKLLVAVDGSASGTHALRESFKLADIGKSWMTAVSVIHPYLGDLGMTALGNVMASMRKPCEEALYEAMRMASGERVMLRAVCEEGDVHERIVDLAEGENFDLIVMGRRGRRRIEKVPVGSVTARVIGYSPRDVLVVPKDKAIGWSKILLATDGSRFSEAAAERAIDFAASYGGEMAILSVVDVPAELYGEAPEAWDKLVMKAEGFVQEIRKKAEASGVKTEASVKEGEVWRTVTGLAGEIGADIIVMGSHGRTGLKRLLMGSVTEKVIGHSPCPVLVVKT